MSNRIKNNLKNLVGQTLNQYYSKVKPTISDLRYKQEYQNRIIDCMVGEVDDNYIETPETDSAIVKLEHSKEGLVKVPSIKGKTILVDADGNETDTPAEGCRLVSVGEDESNKMIILSNNSTINNSENMFGTIDVNTGEEIFYDKNRTCIISGYNLINTDIGVTRLYDKNFNRLSGTDNYNDVTKRYYNKNKEYLGTKKTEDAFFVRYRCLTKYTDVVYDGNATDYVFKDSNYENVDYKQHKTEILLDEPLRKLPNGVCDEVMGNKLIRRIGKVVLNGNENWNNASSFNEYNRFRILHNLQIAFKPYEVNYMTDRIKCIPNKQYQEKSEHIEFDQFHISIMSTIESVELLKQLLKDNPLELFYELKEPIIEELPNGIVLQGFDDTTIYIENEITPTISYGYNALIPYKEELLNQKEEVETNTLDIEQNIIPYLMDMEFNLMLMEDNE